MPNNDIVLDFKILGLDQGDVYFWGNLIYENGNIEATSALFDPFPENIIGILLWTLIILIGIISFISSGKRLELNNAKKLYNINLIFLLFLFALYSVVIISTSLSNPMIIFMKIGLGYYCIIVIILLNYIPKRKLTKSK